jgi:hypothetical protein
MRRARIHPCHGEALDVEQLMQGTQRHVVRGGHRRRRQFRIARCWQMNAWIVDWASQSPGIRDAS